MTMTDRNDFLGKQLDRLRGKDRGVLIDDINETQVGPVDVEPLCPPLNKGAPTQVVTELPDPVPVRIVAHSRGQYVRRNSQTFSVGVKDKAFAPAIGILGKQFNRLRLHLVNPHATNTVYIGTSPEAASFVGSAYPLLAGKEIDLYGFDDWYACLILAAPVSTDIVLLGVVVDYEWDI